MTEPKDLTLAEIAELERGIGSEFDEEITLDGVTTRKLLAIARRLVELESALEFLKAPPNDIKMTLPAPLDHYVRVAQALGWEPGGGE